MSSRRSMSDRNVAIRSCTSAFMRGRAAASLVDSHATIACNCFCAACVASAQSFCTCSDAAATSSSISTLTQNTHGQQASRRRRRSSCSSTRSTRATKQIFLSLKCPEQAWTPYPAVLHPVYRATPTVTNENRAALFHPSIGYCIFEAIAFSGYAIFEAISFSEATGLWTSIFLRIYFKDLFIYFYFFG